MRCYHHDGDYEVWVDQTQLMSTRVYGSEEALAEPAQRLGHRKRRASWSRLGGGLHAGPRAGARAERAVVEAAELVPGRHVEPRAVRTLRGQALEGGARASSRSAGAGGGRARRRAARRRQRPARAVTPGNDSLYSRPGSSLQSPEARGVLAIWSPATRGLRRALRQGPSIQIHHVKARHQGRAPNIWVAMATSRRLRTSSASRRSPSFGRRRWQLGASSKNPPPTR